MLPRVAVSESAVIIEERLALVSMNVSSNAAPGPVAPQTLTCSHRPECVMIEVAPVRTRRPDSPVGGGEGRGDKSG